MPSARLLTRPSQAVGSFLTPGPRMLDEVECAASVLLAILFAHLVGAKMVSWAALTGFVLMRGHISETLVRALLRMIGTAAGAALALALVPYAVRALPMTSLAAGVIAAAGLYGMLTARRAYAWLLFALTFEMILLDKLEHPTLDTFVFAKTRLFEVGAGTAACLIVSVLTTLTARRRWPSTPPPPSQGTGWHSNAARHAMQAGVALALVPVLHAIIGLQELQQAGVTIMAVMIVPVTSLGRSSVGQVTRRLFHRVIGCLCGSVLAAATIFFADGYAPILIAGTFLGVLIGRHIENGGGRFTYVGTQFTLTILITLIPDSYTSAALHPALLRLKSIFFGIALLEPVLLAWYLASHKRRHSRSCPGYPTADNN
jgi:uncharacterized membrane protein YccC